jgi:DnaJ-like protein
LFLPSNLRAVVSIFPDVALGCSSDTGVRLFSYAHLHLAHPSRWIRRGGTAEEQLRIQSGRVGIFSPMSTQQAYPLSWPGAWKRTGWRHASTFGRHSMEGCAVEIYRQLKLLKVGDYNVVISTNVKLRQDGLPYSNQGQPTDPGAAVYFKLKNRPCVLACDKWAKVEDNLWAIAKDIEAQRGRIRWGVGSVEQAFAGYTALPAPGESGCATWYEILGVKHDATFEQAKEAFLRESKLCHPDNGGSHEAQVRLNGAWDQARQAFAQ